MKQNHITRRAFALSSIVLTMLVLLPYANGKEADISNPVKAQADLDPTVLRDKAMRVMETYCVSCHGPEKQKGDVRFDALETIDPVDQQKLYKSAKEALHLQEMPPEKAKQPSQAERAVLMQWLDRQLTGEAAKALAEKLLRFEYGNVVNHEDLFSGKYANLPASAPNRRWLISEYIFNEKVNRLLDYHPTRTIYGKQYPVHGDSGIHWSPKTEQGNKFRRTITNPFLLPKKDGSPLFRSRSAHRRAPADDDRQRQDHRRPHVL